MRTRESLRRLIEGEPSTAVGRGVLVILATRLVLEAEKRPLRQRFAHERHGQRLQLVRGRVGEFGVIGRFVPRITARRVSPQEDAIVCFHNALFP